MIRFDIITIFPDIFENYFNTSIIKRARDRRLIKIKVHNLRRWSVDKHKTVDDKPYGGGPGMILKIKPLFKAIKEITRLGQKKKTKIILLTPQGKTFTQSMARRYAKMTRLVLVCGRYEGVDVRVKRFVDEKISIGNYVLTGGELPAMLIVDAVTRLVPGAIRPESLVEESFGDRETEYPQYTRPEIFAYKDKSGKIRKLKVPKVLLSGNHKKIKEWRERH